jgi:hypothetical protein
MTRMSPMSSSSATSAGQAGNEDVEESDDGIDDACENETDTVDDGHEARAYGAEDACDLDAVR